MSLYNILANANAYSKQLKANELMNARLRYIDHKYEYMKLFAKINLVQDIIAHHTTPDIITHLKLILLQTYRTR